MKKQVGASSYTTSRDTTSTRLEQVRLLLFYWPPV
jgi:hypothetical protein